jgi:hypothetical protein
VKVRILKKHVGRTVIFTGFNRADGIEQSGKIVDVKNGIAVILADFVTVRESFDGEEYTRRETTGTGEPFRVLLEVNHPNLRRID